MTIYFSHPIIDLKPEFNCIFEPESQLK